MAAMAVEVAVMVLSPRFAIATGLARPRVGVDVADVDDGSLVATAEGGGDDVGAGGEMVNLSVLVLLAVVVCGEMDVIVASIQPTGKLSPVGN